MPDEFEKRIDLICVATGLKEAALSFEISDSWKLFAGVERVQNVPFLPASVSDSDPLVMVAQLPPGVDPQSVTAVLYSGTPPIATEVNVTFDMRSPVKGLNIFLQEDIVGDYIAYVYFYNTTDTYLINSGLQLRYKVDANLRLQE